MDTSPGVPSSSPFSSTSKTLPTQLGTSHGLPPPLQVTPLPASASALATSTATNQNATTATIGGGAGGVTPAGPIHDVPEEPKWNPQGIRTSSIDSGISSLSSTQSAMSPSSYQSRRQHQQNHGSASSAGSAATSSKVATEEVAHVIKAAGSAEAAISRLILDKRSLIMENGNLRQLIEKQRPVLKGLNQDFESKVKENERYKQKLAEMEEAMKKDAVLPNLGEAVRSAFNEPAVQDPLSGPAPFAPPFQDGAGSTSQLQKSISLRETPKRDSASISPSDTTPTPPRRALTEPMANPGLPSIEDSTSEYEEENVDNEGGRAVSKTVHSAEDVVTIRGEPEERPSKERRQHTIRERPPALSPPPTLPLPPLPHHHRSQERLSAQPLSEKEKENLYYKQLPLPPIPPGPPPLPVSKEHPSRPTSADDRGRTEMRDTARSHAHRQSLSARPPEGKKSRDKGINHFDSLPLKGSSSNSSNKRSKRLTISTDLVPRFMSNSPIISQPTPLSSSHTFPTPPSFSASNGIASLSTTTANHGKSSQSSSGNGSGASPQKIKTGGKLGLQTLMDNNSRGDNRVPSPTRGPTTTRHTSSLNNSSSSSSSVNNNTAPSNSSAFSASSPVSSTTTPPSSKQRHILVRRGSPRVPDITFRDPFAQHSTNPPPIIETPGPKPSTPARPANTTDFNLSGWQRRADSLRTPTDDPLAFRRPSLNDSYQIYRGLVSDDLPDILVPPSSLHAIEIRVVSSRLRPKRESCNVQASGFSAAGVTGTNTFNKHNDNEENVFTLGVFPRKPSPANNTNPNNVNFPPGFFSRGELWRVEKPLSSLPTFDAMLRPVVTDFPVRIPERSLFSGHSPFKIDARRTALNAYFGAALEASRNAAVAGGDVAAGMVVCQFLSSNVIDPRDDEAAINKRMTEMDYPVSHNNSNRSLDRTGSVDDGNNAGEIGSLDLDSSKPYMEGYLTKKGKNFGGWKARYFILNSQKLTYYDTPRGSSLGTINLRRAKVYPQLSNVATSGNGSNASGNADSNAGNINNNGSFGSKEDIPSISHQSSLLAENNDSQYRHAFVIREYKKNVKHTFCAESDDERDAWVSALLYYVDEDGEDDAQAAGAAISSGTNDDTPHHHHHHHHHHNPLSSRRERRSVSMPPSSRKTIIGKGKDKTSTFTDDSSVPSNEPMISIRYDDLPGREIPTRGSNPDYRSNSPNQNNQPQTPVGDKDKKLAELPGQPQRSDSGHHLNISSPTNGSVIQNAGAWGLKPSSRASGHGSTRIGSSARERKRSIFSSLRTSTAVIGGSNGESTREAGKRVASDAAALARARSDDPEVPQMPNGNHSAGGNGGTTSASNDPNRYAVFGIPLADAVAIAPPRDLTTNRIIDCGLPAVVYRLLTYLRAQKAELEEGIFRLSGSSATVRQLKEKFATEGDFDLLAEGEPYIDVHAVASLFKQYLRELPSSVLTKELHNEFAKALDIKDSATRLTTYRQLISRLPVPNRALLHSVIEMLYHVVNNQDVNLMNLRNVGIVFTPTLNIPTSVFCALLHNFDLLFESPDTSSGSSVNLPLPPMPETGADCDESGTTSDVGSETGDSNSDIQTNSVLPSITGNAANSSSSSLHSAPPVHPASSTFSAAGTSASSLRKRNPRFSHFIDVRASNSIPTNTHSHTPAYLAAPGSDASANVPGKLNVPTSPISLPPPSPSHAFFSYSPLPSPSGGSASRRKR